MFTRETLDDLRVRLESARAALRARELTERDAWRLMSDADAARRDAQGTPFEGTTAVVADLVHSLWRITHARDQALRRIGAQ